MGQIFYACAYDIDTKTCCVYDADKFHANCYGCCGTVFSMHYLLRQKAYRIMWGGGYVFLWDNLKKFSRTEDLLGMSTYSDMIDLTPRENYGNSKETEERIKFVADHRNQWKKMNVWKEAKTFFNWEITHSVKYEGVLLNHTQKLAIDLADYYRQSCCVNEMTIDAVPVLTETGEGVHMAFFDGVFVESTEELAGTWCGDLLQIVDELPEGFQLINCCFAEIWSKAKYYYRQFGANEKGLVITNAEGKLYEAADLDFYFKRCPLTNVKVTIEEKESRIKFTTVKVE